MKQSKPKPLSFKKDKAPADAFVKKGTYELKGRIWIEGRDGTFLGYGRVALLEKIKEYGSISEAAKSINMSYRHAWELIDSINRQAKLPLIESSTGGKGGGGAKLTEAGELAITAFHQLYARFMDFIEKEVENINT